VREVVGERVVGQAAQRVVVATRGEDLEVAEAGEGRCDAAHDRTRFVARVTVVEHVAQHRLAGGHQAQRARGRHAEMVHRLAAQELTQ
jgi:hypothetical protein